MTKRIDFVFVWNSSTLGAVSIDTEVDDAFTVGCQPANRVAGEDGATLWPSDHAGVGGVPYDSPTHLSIQTFHRIGAGNFSTPLTCSR